MQQEEGGSQYVVSPTEMASQFSSAHVQSQRVVEAASPISSRSGPPANFFDEAATGGGGRWPRQETVALLKIRSEMDAGFRDATLKGPLWEDVSRKMAELGFKRSSKKCKEKFENVHKYYKRTKEGRAGRQDGKTYRFFSELEALYSTPTAATDIINSLPPLNCSAATPLEGIQPPPPQSTAAPTRISFSSNTSSSSSDSDGDDTDDAGDRKSKRSGKTTAFYEGLIKQLMERQEAMQQRFFETIEKREQDRTARDESWKRQEMARLNRERELMAQERAMTANRDAAVISFLQKFAAAGATPNSPNPFPEPPPVSISPKPAAPAASPPSRWPKAEVLALIKMRSGMEVKYQESVPKGPLWEEISHGMKGMGYNRSTKRCKEKWENINKYFKKVKEGSKKRPLDAKTCPYFHELDLLYSKKQRQESGDTNQVLTICEGGGLLMPGSGANGHSWGLFGGATTDAASKKPEGIVRELMERQNDEEEEEDVDVDVDVDEDDYEEDEEDEENNKLRYEIQFQRQNVGNSAGNVPVSTQSSNATSFLAMVQ